MKKKATSSGKSGEIIPILIIALSIIGVLVSELALGERYRTGSSPCSINDVWDCGAVNRSSYALLYGMPVAMIGVMGYAFVAAIAGKFPRLTMGTALIGMLFSLRLSWVEWKVLEMWGIYCVVSQGVIVTIFLLSMIHVYSNKQDVENSSS